MLLMSVIVSPQIYKTTSYTGPVCHAHLRDELTQLHCVVSGEANQFGFSSIGQWLAHHLKTDDISSAEWLIQMMTEAVWVHSISHTYNKW